MSANGTGTGGAGTQLVGLVAAVNANGIKLDGGDGWLNFSKFAPGLVPPQRGQRVTVQLDKSGFVRGIETITDAPHSPVAGRETAIIRQTCLKGGRGVLRR